MPEFFLGTPSFISPLIFSEVKICTKGGKMKNTCFSTYKRGSRCKMFACDIIVWHAEVPDNVDSMQV